MGIETIALVVAAVGATATVAGTMQQNRQARKAAGAQKEASDVSSAQQRIEDMEQRRQQIRQQRIRQSQIEQSASNAGVSESSGELGSLSALSTNAASNLAMMSGRNLAAQGIGAANQQAANAQGQAQTWGAISQLGGAAMRLGVQGGATRGAMNLFAPASAGKLSTDTDNMILGNPNLF